MKIVLAAHLGMCFGVRDAIAMALDAALTHPVTILGDLVHNETVLQNLREQGVKIEHQVAAVTTPEVWITAHGASQTAIRRAQKAGLQVREATCPLVHHAHRALRTLIASGFYPVIIGRRDHVEVKGMTEDLDRYSVVLSEKDIVEVPREPRLGVMAQTTQPIDKVERLVECLRRSHPECEIRFIDTVCQPTKQRQAAAIELAKQCQIVIVVGGASSNNTHELAATCRRHCPRVYHVQRAEDLHATWFKPEDTVGLTAGTSTPDPTIREVEAWLREFGAFQQRLAEHLAKPVAVGAEA